MIKYSLKCDKSHDFDSWFGSISDYERLQDAGMLSCAVCGSGDVTRAIMAPQVNTTEAPSLSGPASPAEQALRALRKDIEDNSEDVGNKFASEARKIHDGDAPERSIYGQAKPEEAKALIEDGIQVAPLPWNNSKKN